MLDLQQLTSFVAVVNAGSFVGAADVLGLSKAAVSRHVGDLEGKLGVRLLHRTTRRLSLTDEGQRFHARATELLAHAGELEAETSSGSGEATGLLRINAPTSFGNLHLAPLWGPFAQAHPDVALDVALSDRVVDLVEEGYDLAVRITNLQSSQLVSRLLASTRMVACASPRYLREHGTPTHPRELAQHRVASYSYWTTRDEWSFTGPDGEVSVRTRPFMHTNNGDTCRRAALDHEALVLQPDFLVGPDLARGDLVEVMPGYRSLTLGIHAVFATRKHLPTKTRAMVDFLVASFQAPPWRGSPGQAGPSPSATGNFQPRRSASQRSTKHSTAPATATGAVGSASAWPATSTSAPANAATAYNSVRRSTLGTSATSRSRATPPPTPDSTPSMTAPTGPSPAASAFSAPITANSPSPAASNNCTGLRIRSTRARE